MHYHPYTPCLHVGPIMLLSVRIHQKNHVLYIVPGYVATMCTTFRVRFLLLIVPSSRIFSILTNPATFAKRVWSFPIPTLSPARNRWPRCLTKIEPALAGSLWRTLIPSRRPIESLPLLVDPPAFFVAIPRAVMVYVVAVAHDEEREARDRIIVFYLFTRTNSDVISILSIDELDYSVALQFYLLFVVELDASPHSAELEYRLLCQVQSRCSWLC